MNQQKGLEWCKNQDIVKISCVKEGEDDKFIFTVGQYNIVPLMFDSQEEAEKYLERNFKLTNFDLAVIGAMCQRLYEINKLDSSNLKNNEK